MKKTLLTVLLALCLLAPAAFAESSPTDASCAGKDYTLTAVLTSSGMRAALTFSFRNTGPGSAALLVRSIALDGEWSVGFLTKHNPGLEFADSLSV